MFIRLTSKYGEHLIRVSDILVVKQETNSEGATVVYKTLGEQSSSPLALRLDTIHSIGQIRDLIAKCVLNFGHVGRF